MAEIARPRTQPFPAGPAEGWLSRPLAPAVQRVLAREIDWELAGYVALVAVAFTLRIWDVGGRAMHHDESLHATYAWYLFKGRGYQYNPLMHGPLQFYVMAFFYMLFGDSETTARLFAVLCGTAIVLLPYFLRKDLGRNGAFVAAIALAISPAFLYYSRFARDDIILDFFTLLMVVGIWSYIRTRRARCLYIAAAAAALAMASMEAAYIVFFIFGIFFLLILLVERLDPAPAARAITQAVTSISLEVWLYAMTILVVSTIVLFSTFLSNPHGVFDPGYSLLSPSRQDILGGVTYWLSQHGVARGGQPWFYYLLLFPLYEQFALIFGAAGLVWAIFRKDLFTTFLGFWFVLSLAIYSWAGEKMPWLFLHPLLPAILLAGAFVGDLLACLRRPGRVALITTLAMLFLAEVHSAQALTYADAANPTEMLIYVQTSNDVPMVAADVLGVVHHVRPGVAPPLIQVDDADLQGWPFEWYFRNLPAADVSYSSSFADPTAPILIMLGPEHDQFNAGLMQRYSVSKYRWNWWFPEDYKGLTFDNGMCGTAAHEVVCAPGQAGTVFLKTGSPCPAAATVAGRNCSLIQTPAAINVITAITQPSTWQNLWSWFVFRTPFGQRSDRPLYLYVRKDMLPRGSRGSSSGGSGTSLYKSLPATQIESFGSSGPPKARLVNPRGISVGPRGNLYVADAGNHRVAIFSPSGVFIRSFGVPGTGLGQFNLNQSPMDVAVSAKGTMYVADWWGHRIEEFSPSGRFIRAWGHYGLTGPDGFYGPRSVAIGPSGNVYVADTGNRQIAVFSSTGRFLFRFGRAGSSAGRFEEPSSVIVDSNGDVYVADMWNSRIQRFDGEGHFLGSWPVPSWQSQSYDEPYLAATSNGDILATDPAAARVLEFTSSGHAVGEFPEPNLSLPIGVAAASNGIFYVSDAGGNRVVQFRAGAKVIPIHTTGRGTRS
jgi:uncharacterized protein (TIGR03663 family)